MKNTHVPDIQQRDDANEIETKVKSALQRWFIRWASGSIIFLIRRRLDREFEAGKIDSAQRTRLINVFVRTFKEDTDA